MTRPKQAQFVPIFEKDGNRFFVLFKDWVADNEWDAKMIGYGAMLVELVLWQAKNTFEVIEVSQGILHVPGKLTEFPVAIISGPDGPK